MLFNKLYMLLFALLFLSCDNVVNSEIESSGVVGIWSTINSSTLGKYKFNADGKGVYKTYRDSVVKDSIEISYSMDENIISITEYYEEYEQSSKAYFEIVSDTLRITPAEGYEQYKDYIPEGNSDQFYKIDGDTIFIYSKQNEYSDLKINKGFINSGDGAIEPINIGNSNLYTEPFRGKSNYDRESLIQKYVVKNEILYVWSEKSTALFVRE